MAGISAFLSYCQIVVVISNLYGSSISTWDTHAPSSYMIEVVSIFTCGYWKWKILTYFLTQAGLKEPEFICTGPDSQIQ